MTGGLLQSAGVWARRAFMALVAAAAASIVWVFAYGMAGPPITAVMVGRALAGETLSRRRVELDAISPHLVRAVIAAEDTRFCRHAGFDVTALKSAIAQARSGGRLRGASTITQQTAKNAFLWNGGGYPRKALEAWFTPLIETVWGKRRIMEVYLNAAEWGDGVFGAEAAARARFGVSAAALTERQAALLASVLPNPASWRVDPPGPYVLQRAATIQARAKTVLRDGLDDCVFRAAPIR